MSAKSIVMAGAAGAVAANYIEDVFSTFLYTGTGATEVVNNGIDLAGKGGLVWLKARTSGPSGTGHSLQTSTGGNSSLSTNNTNPAGSGPIGAFTSNGFEVFGGSAFDYTFSGTNYVSWTFRKQPKFFDVVTWTGNGSNRTISHSLGSVPGCIIVKRTDTAADWQVYHRSLANTEYMVLNTTAAKDTGTTRWNSTTPTATEFSLGTDTTVNASGGTYVAYLFAHDAGGFGASGTDNVISCGSTDGVSTVNLGYEPQWVLVKASSSTGDWYLIDNMRGWTVPGGAQQWLFANSSSSEGTYNNYGGLNSTGFSLNISAGVTYIYIAIRRGPMRTPTTGTSVYNAVARTGTNAVATVTGVGFAPDLVIPKPRTVEVYGPSFMDRLRGPTARLQSDNTSAEGTPTTSVTLTMDGMYIGDNGGGPWVNGGFGATYINWFFRRAPGFFDVVCDTGTGSAHTITHNLGVVPELMIRKKRSAADAWIVYANNDNTDYLVLNTTAATVDDNTMWNDTSPTSSVFTVGTNDDVNGNGATFVTYLFATVAGVSKVGSYTGTGTTLQVNCGFTAGARFVLIKRTDSTGDWYVWDSSRGIVAANDPHLSLNSTAAEVTTNDSIDPDNSGFIVNQVAATNINVSSATYIFLAIA